MVFFGQFGSFGQKPYKLSHLRKSSCSGSACSCLTEQSLKLVYPSVVSLATLAHTAHELPSTGRIKKTLFPHVVTYLQFRPKCSMFRLFGQFWVKFGIVAKRLIHATYFKQLLKCKLFYKSQLPVVTCEFPPVDNPDTHSTWAAMCSEKTTAPVVAFNYQRKFGVKMP